MASGIKNLQRVDAVDPDGRTEGGRLVFGLAPFGHDKGAVVYLNGDAIARFATAFRASMVGAAEASS